jgi:HAMP domain-containing protein
MDPLLVAALLLLGAFTGFAFSRRLRHRIRRASTGR